MGPPGRPGPAGMNVRIVYVNPHNPSNLFVLPLYVRLTETNHILSIYHREKTVVRVLLGHQGLLVSKVHPEIVDPKVKGVHQDHLVHLGLKARKEKWVLTEDLADLGLQVLQGPQEIEEHQDCQDRQDQ